MKKLLLYVFAALAFAACTQDVVVDITPAPIVDEAPETLVVGFEGDDTRIQLNEAQKTVWTNGDLVSVFYRSNANQQWKYDGETGARTANLKRVDAGTATRDMDRVVVVYPYNEDYYINPSTFNVQASLPATQHYLANSYGLDGNIMISSAEYNDVTLKNVCGWLKLQLTGDGEVVKSITFKGNNGEQVAGELYINSAEATAILASDMGNIAEDDGNNATGGAGANLSFDDVVLKKVTLDCGEGVTLGAEATAFYIALPPQTFENGFTIEVECDGYRPMIISTSNSITIDRNHIQPMAPKEHNALPITPNNQIWYTATDVVEPYNIDVFGATIISNEWDPETGKGIITFDGNITMIEYEAFRNCYSLTSVNIPDSVTTIGPSAFKGCRSLTSVNIPDSVTTIGPSAFDSCSSLTSVTIPDSVTTIGDFAFYFCYSLTSVNIGNSVTTIGYAAFHSCDSLTSVNIPESVTTIGWSAFEYCTSLTSVNIPDSVTTIGEDAFIYCRSLKQVYCYATIPPSFGSSAFSNNAGGRRIYVYEECVELYKSAWSSYKDSIYTNGQNCPETTTIQYTTNDGNIVTTKNMPVVSNIYDNGVGTLVVVGKIALIPNNAFRSCSSLTSLTIPDSVTTIGNYAFYECSSLTSVTIPDSVTTIEHYAFYDCSKLTSVTIPDSVTEIGGWAFAGCSSLTSLTIPDSVTRIISDAFRSCSSLTSVTIPDSVTTIGNEAFYDCNSLTSVYCKATTPPLLGGPGVFDNNASGRRIIVPIGSGEAYKTAGNWSEYANDIFEDEF